MDDFPAFIRPQTEPGQCVPGSFYINMQATCPEYRNRSVGTGKKVRVDDLASAAGCILGSIELFEERRCAAAVSTPGL